MRERLGCFRHEWFRAFTANPCQHAVLYDHGELAGCLYPDSFTGDTAFIFGRQIRRSQLSTTVRCEWVDFSRLTVRSFRYSLLTC